MFVINYKDAGYFEIKDSEMETDLITRLYWDGKIEYVHLGIQVDWGDNDHPHGYLTDEELDDLIKITAFTRKIRFLFSFVSNCEKANFTKSISDYGLLNLWGDD